MPAPIDIRKNAEPPDADDEPKTAVYIQFNLGARDVAAILIGAPILGGWAVLFGWLLHLVTK